MEIITADRALAGSDLEVIERAALVIDGDRITWVGREADLDPDLVERAGTVRSLGEATLLPGLIDAHVHLAFDGGPTPVTRMMAEGDSAQVALMLRSARELLSVGVTTARDLGSRDYLGVDVREAISSGTARGPRILTSGPAITVTGGHCWFMNGEVDSPDAMRTMVRRHHKAGVDCIKVMSTGGNMTPGSMPWHAQFTETELHVAVDEAHRLGKKVAAHAHGVEGIRRALAAGVDSLEHCSFQTEEGFGGFDPELADAIAASDTWVSPTCSARMSDFRRLLPEREFPLRELYARGVKLMASTDAGIDNNPHYGYVYGLLAMHEFEIPIRDVLRAATSGAARGLGLAGVTGELTAGTSADVIAVAGDPLQNLAQLHELRMVVARGEHFTPDPVPPIEPLDPEDLPEMLRRMVEASRVAREQALVTAEGLG